MKLGIQSFCYRNFKDNAQVADMVRDCGLSAIEICRVHVDFSDSACHAPAVDTYRQKDVEIISTGVNMITGNEEQDRALFEFAKAAGTKYMSVNFKLADLDVSLPMAEKLAEEYDMLLGIHNHGGYHWLGSSEPLDWVFSKSTKRIGLCMDTAWAIDAKQNPVEWAKKYADRLYNVHFKDFLYGQDRNHRDVIVGTGNLDLEALSKTLDEIDFQHIGVIEYEGDPENPIAEIKQCVEKIGQHFSC